jgi:hypothetical protein
MNGNNIKNAYDDIVTGHVDFVAKYIIQIFGLDKKECEHWIKLTHQGYTITYTHKHHIHGEVFFDVIQDFGRVAVRVLSSMIDERIYFPATQFELRRFYDTLTANDLPPVSMDNLQCKIFYSLSPSQRQIVPDYVKLCLAKQYPPTIEGCKLQL